MAQNQSPSFLDEAPDSWWCDTWAQMIRLREEVHAWWRLVTVMVEECSVIPIRNVGIGFDYEIPGTDTATHWVGDSQFAVSQQCQLDGRNGQLTVCVSASQGAYVKLGWGRVCEIVGLNFSNTFRCGSETWSCHRNTSDARNSQTHALIIATGCVPVHT